jgi:endogenous inhibitor of DNA gyrase (YacG/DUF329 family)
MPDAPQPCAYCRRHAAADAFFPFCCERCKMADLGQWLTGGYSVTGRPVDPRDDGDPFDGDPSDNEATGSEPDFPEDNS